MIPDDQQPLIPLPAESVTGLANLLTQLDEFLRSSPLVVSELASFLARRGGLHVHPRFAANTIVDELGFTAFYLSRFTGSTLEAAPGTVIADVRGEDLPQPDPPGTAGR